MLRAGVAVTDADGNALEGGGEASETPANSGRGVYAATAAVGTTVRIAVTAMDRPGSVTEAAEEKAV